mmetsp:Transcript_34095/g.86578  ORF Transcript_34095/g.86578 Transcript_34095/m.86578 type:complete len:540 (-) Transcript_34095:154-1773(-)
MLLYPHSFAGLPLLYQVAGSAVPRAVVPALVSMLITLAIEETLSQEFLTHVFAHPYPYTVFANLVGFTLVFRTNIAYTRYWEGITQLRQMSAKWGDSAFLVLSMDCHEQPSATPSPDPPQPGQHTLSSTRQLYRAAVCHRFSLLHAIAIAHLRREVQLRKFTTAAVLNRTDEPDKRPIKASARSTDGWCRGLLNSFWPSRYEEFLDDNPLPVLGGVSDPERRVLETLNSEERVHSELARVLATINSRRAAGGLAVDAPAVSRIHQTLSDGNLGFYQACKLEDTPLPFPYAQVVSLVLVIFAVTYPLLACSKASGFEGFYAHWLAPTLSFVVVLSYFGLYEVARELEDPFIHPPNEAPLVAVQQSFNARLLSGWDALDGAYASECVPDGMEGLGLRAISTAQVEQLETAWRQRNGSGGSELAGAAAGWSAATAALPAAAASLRTRVGVGDASAAQQGDDIALVRLPSQPSVTSTPVGAELPRDSSPSPERLCSSLRSPTRGTSHKSTRTSSNELSSPRLLRKANSYSTDFKVPRGVQVVS